MANPAINYIIITVFNCFLAFESAIIALQGDKT